MIKELQKVYIISKSYGNPLDMALERAQRNHNSLKREMIRVNGKPFEAVIGYYAGEKKYIQGHDVRIVKYTTSTDRGGDFYLRTDFLTRDQVNTIHIDLPEELFEI